MKRAALFLPVLAAAAAACLNTNPVHQSQVDALGGEAPGVPVGEFHRAGQPCAVCHSADGPASTSFVLAGTVFSDPNKTIGVSGANVVFVDDSLTNFTVTTNCVGNFFVTTNDWNPAFPVRVEILAGSSNATMMGHISREASCANCHNDPPRATSPGHVWIAAQANPNDPNCPVSPVAGAGGP